MLYISTCATSLRLFHVTDCRTLGRDFGILSLHKFLMVKIYKKAFTVHTVQLSSPHNWGLTTALAYMHTTAQIVHSLPLYLLHKMIITMHSWMKTYIHACTCCVYRTVPCFPYELLALLIQFIKRILLRQPLYVPEFFFGKPILQFIAWTQAYMYMYVRKLV